LQILANDADQPRFAPKRGDIGSDIRRSAEDMPFVCHLQHRHRRLRRNPPDTAKDVMIEHDIANDRDDPARQALNKIMLRHDGSME
jgi:hypothetical protein